MLQTVLSAPSHADFLLNTIYKEGKKKIFRLLLRKLFSWVRDPGLLNHGIIQ